MATAITASRQVVEDYQKLFVNRRAYTMQSLRPHPESGRHYYLRASKNGTDIPLMLTDETIRQHLEGKITVGLYAINPSTTHAPARRCCCQLEKALFFACYVTLLPRSLLFKATGGGCRRTPSRQQPRATSCFQKWIRFLGSPSSCEAPRLSSTLPGRAP